MKQSYDETKHGKALYLGVYSVELFTTLDGLVGTPT